MKILKLQRMGASTVLTIPRDIMRRWEKSGTRYVEVTLHQEGLLVRPLSLEEALRHPAPEEVDVEHDAGT